MIYINNYIFELNNKDITKLKCQSTHNTKKTISLNIAAEKSADSTKISNIAAAGNQVLHLKRSSYNLKGETLGRRYYMLNIIQEKKYTVIYQAKCLILNRYVMVEILKQNNEVHLDEFIVYPELVEKFFAGNQALAAFNFPNVISVYDLGKEDDGIKYSVKEFVGNHATLAEKFKEKKNKPFSLNKTIRYTKQLIQIINSVYKNESFLHCDICPENIFINQNDEVMLNYTCLSFNELEIRNEVGDYKSAVPSVLHENYNYVYPEREMCLQSDMYSIGCIMYRMIFGHDIFSDERQEMLDLLMAHMTKSPDFPEGYNSNGKQRLIEIIKRLLNKKPGDRYSSYEELLTDFEKIHIGFFS